MCFVFRAITQPITLFSSCSLPARFRGVSVCLSVKIGQSKCFTSIAFAPLPSLLLALAPSFTYVSPPPLPPASYLNPSTPVPAPAPARHTRHMQPILFCGLLPPPCPPLRPAINAIYWHSCGICVASIYINITGHETTGVPHHHHHHQRRLWPPSKAISTWSL